ncbi:mRNA 3' end processing factor [Marasmius crinis-equi]|uniref:mRNA 3' end processing factor n=1 Tax=Marasmius crinis-equi TaxID=585013 RepID=A0ABR3FF49_9AGAR
MSLYPQPPQPYYSQQSYGASSSYSQMPSNGLPNYSYPVPAPPPASAPMFYVDPATFRRDLSQRLAELTVNSRPIIQSLSMYAQDYVRFAEIVAQCLESHIRRVPPWMKLPALYLLDMISKNIYEPYARHFATFIVPLFIKTYHQVDEPTRSKMLELLLTWRTGFPPGKELFGVPAQVSIERSIWGDGSNNNNNHVAVLQQLRRLVEAGVSQEELNQILGQLRSLMRTATQPSPPPPPPSVSAPPPSWSPAPPAPFTAPPPVLPPATPVQSVTPMKLEPIAPQDVSVPPPAVAPVPSAAAGFADLLSSLLKSGVVSANATPVGAGSTVTEQAADFEREGSRTYRTTLLDHTVQLSTVGLTRSKPAIQSLLYNRLSLQCKQCGLRFFDSVTGKKELEDHLDMHFRQNLKANQNIGRGHSRSWFIGVEDWVHDVPDTKGKGRADRPLNPRAAAAAEAHKRDAELRSQYVVVPPGDESKTISCPVCKEILSPEFVEDDEEWVWKNAVKKDERIYHATCHAEASSNTLVARLRTDVTSSRSRSGTPERVLQTKQQSPLRGVSSSPDTKLAGIKRKVEDDDTISEPEGTPQLKKVALSSS